MGKKGEENIHFDILYENNSASGCVDGEFCFFNFLLLFSFQKSLCFLSHSVNESGTAHGPAMGR